MATYQDNGQEDVADSRIGMGSPYSAPERAHRALPDEGIGGYEPQVIPQGPGHEETVEGIASLHSEDQMATRATTGLAVASPIRSLIVRVVAAVKAQELCWLERTGDDSSTVFAPWASLSEITDHNSRERAMR